MIGEIGPCRPRKDELATKGDRAQSVETMEPAELLLEAEIEELAHRTRCQTIAAGLLTREVLLVDEDDIVTCSGEPIRGG